MLKLGNYIRVQTKTQNDVFGVCLYRVDEVGLPAPEKQRRKAGVMDGVKCTMLGGSGPAARAGMTLNDSQAAIAANIKIGITEVISEPTAQALVRQFESATSAIPPGGVVEIDW